MKVIDAIYNGFFSLLNQLILIGMSFATIDSGSYRWVGLPFAVLFLSVNGWTIVVWRRNGLKRACEFYSKANIRCFLALALSGLLIVSLARAGDALHRFSN
jgi:uncharacterized membrane protein